MPKEIEMNRLEREIEELKKKLDEENLSNEQRAEIEKQIEEKQNQLDEIMSKMKNAMWRGAGMKPPTL